MAWPLSQDYNEAVQDPQTAFADPELKAGQPILNALGMPVPRSGNFADVYEHQGPGGEKWAVKCFTREVPGQRERYAEISKALSQVRLPFTVDFQYLEQGIRVCGQWFPILKMRWVEGLLLNEFVRDSLERKNQLEALGHIWVRMARRLREVNLAHGDLQHGNVILVPGSKNASLAVKLIDYDGMFVPALESRSSGEVGHPAYQHPERAKEAVYNSNLDHFSLLAVYCALRGLVLRGTELWQRFDNGDNLLFREKDFRNPGQSALLKELWQVQDAILHDLVGHLTLACQGLVDQVPILDRLLIGDAAKPLTADAEDQVTKVLGQGARVQRRPIVAIQAATSSNDVSQCRGQRQSLSDAEPLVHVPERLKRFAGRPLWPWLLAGSCAISILAGFSFLFFAHRNPPAEDQNASTKTVALDRPKKKENPAIEDKRNAVIENPIVIPSQWRHLDISSARIDEDFLRIGPRSKLATRESFTGPIEVQLLARSDGNRIAVKTRSGQVNFQLAYADTWYKLRWRITETYMEVYINDRLTGRKDLQPTVETSPVWVETQAETVEVKSLDVTQIDPSTRVPRNLTDHLTVEEELDCSERGFQFAMGEAFDPDKSWKLVLEFMTPDTDARGRTILQWGNNSGSKIALCVRLVGATLDISANVSQGKATRIRIELPPDLATRWVSFQVHYDASSHNLAAMVAGKMSQNVQLLEALKGDRDKPVRVGRAANAAEPFPGKIRKLWLGNVVNTMPDIRRPNDPPIAKKMPIPDEDVLLAADKQMRAMFKDEKEPAKRTRLIAKLLKQAGEAQDAAMRFVCLREIRDLAALAVDLPMAWQTVEQIDRTFTDSPIEHYLRIMELAKKSPRSRQKDEELLVASLRILDEIKQADAFEWMNKAVPLGQGLAARLSKEPWKAILDRAVKAMTQVAKEHEHVKPFQDRLKEVPGDKMAALEVGRYIAFLKEDWEKGLRLLAGVGSGSLAEIAKKDLAQPVDPQAQLELADAWEDAARAEFGLARNNIRERAKMWYYRALPRLEGTDRARVDERLKFKFPPGYLKPGLLVGYLEGKTVIKNDLEFGTFKVNWGSLKPEQLAKGVSVRWRGVVSVPQVRHYVVSVEATGYAKVSLDKKVVVETYKNETRKSRPVLVSDGFNPLQVEYRCQDGTPRFELQIQAIGIGVEAKTPLTFYHRPDK